jgi:hypothetical protein
LGLDALDVALAVRRVGRAEPLVQRAPFIAPRVAQNPRNGAAGRS